MDDQERAARAARAEERRKRAILRWVDLEDDSRDTNPVTGPEALSLVTQLTREAWSLSGQPLPSYTRPETPYRFVPGWPR